MFLVHSDELVKEFGVGDRFFPVAVKILPLHLAE